MRTRTLLLGPSLLIACVAIYYAADVNLPAPYATSSSTNRPKVIARPDGAQLRVPQGFNVEVWAERNPASPRLVKVTEANVTYVAIDRGGRPRELPR